MTAVLAKFRFQMILIISSFGSTLTVLVIPMCTSVYHYWVAMAASGFCSVGMEISSTVWLMDMWPKEASGPYFMGYFLSVMFGGIASSTLAAPFLSKPHDNQTTVASGPQDADHSHIIVPYSIVAGISFAVVVAQVIVFYWRPYVQSNRTEDQQLIVNDLLADETRSDVRVTILGSLLLFFAYGGYQTFASLLPEFVVFCGLHLDKVTGANMFTVQMIAAAVSMLVCTWIATKVSSRIMLYGELVIAVVGGLLLLWSSSHSQYMMWFSVALLGLGLGPTPGSSYAFLATQATLTNRMIACFTLAKNVSTSLMVYVIGRMIEDEAISLVFLTLASSTLSLVVLAFFSIKSQRSL